MHEIAFLTKNLRLTKHFVIASCIQTKKLAKVTCIEIKLRAFCVWGIIKCRPISLLECWLPRCLLDTRRYTVENVRQLPLSLKKKITAGIHLLGTGDVSIHSNSLWAYLLYSRWLKWFNSLMDVNWRTYTSSKHINKQQTVQRGLGNDKFNGISQFHAISTLVHISRIQL